MARVNKSYNHASPDARIQEGSQTYYDSGRDGNLAMSVSALSTAMLYPFAPNPIFSSAPTFISAPCHLR